MQYVGQFLVWLIVIAAIVVTIKGFFILCAKRAVYPKDIFKEIEVSNIKRYNMLNGILLIALGVVFATVALALRHSSVNLPVILLIGICFTVPELEKRVENNYIISK